MYTINELNDIINSCELCPLHKTKKNYVIADGNIDSDIMIIGEAPGQREDETGKVFVGPAGILLDKMLKAINLDSTKVYITNICKCRPPRNRNPLPEERDACKEYLRWQFKIMKPKIVVLLGSVASKTILNNNFKITKEHGKIVEKNGILFLPTFHPSYLLYDPSKKKLAWQDLQKLEELIKK